MDSDTLDRIVRETFGDAEDISWTARQNGRDSIANLMVTPSRGRTATIEAWGEVSHLRLDDGTTFTLIEYEDDGIADNLRQLEGLGYDNPLVLPGQLDLRNVIEASRPRHFGHPNLVVARQGPIHDRT